ncbi:hypothetical protein [Lysobacter sp. CA196]|uniref:hypothetical protein n=1 Tax=Lysobacter sp. CA196 TaxID=3455606 RepID=UPI003F8D6940
MPESIKPGTPASELEEFRFAMEPLTEKVNISAPTEPFEIGALTSESPGLGGSIGKLAGVAGAALGVGFGIVEIKDGLDTGNTEQVVTGGITVGTSVGIPIAAEILGELAGAMVGDIFGGAAGLIVAEGFSIYNGVKAEKLIDAAKAQDRELLGKYRTYVQETVTKLEGAKKIISGDTAFQINENVADSGNLLFKINEDRVEYLANKVMAEAVKVKAEKMEGYYTPVGLPNFSAASTDPDVHVRYLSDAAKNLQARYFVYEFLDTKIPGGPTIRANKAHWETNTFLELYEPTTGVPNPYVGAQAYYEDVVGWAHEVAAPATTAVVEETLGSKQELIDEFKNYVHEEMSAPEYQQKLMERYNTAVSKKLVWYIFGEELLNNLDLRVFSAEDGLLWFLRIFNPVVAGLLDAKVTEGVLAEVQVASTVMALVNYMVQQEVNIYNKSELDRALHDKIASFDKFPVSLRNSVNTALDKTRTRVAALIISPAGMKRLNYDAAALDRALAALPADHFTKGFDTLVGKYVDELMPQAPKPSQAGSGTQASRDALRAYYVDLLEESAVLQGGYMKSVQDELNRTGEVVRATLTDPLNKQVLLCMTAKEYEDAAERVDSIYGHYVSQRIVLPTHKWVSFESVPGVKKETYTVSQGLRKIAAQHRAEANKPYNGIVCKSDGYYGNRPLPDPLPSAGSAGW